MTASTDKKQIPRKNIFDNKEDDLILAELHTINDDSEVKIAPLEHYHFNEDTLDSSVVNESLVASDSQTSNLQFNVSHPVEDENPADKSDNIKTTKFELAQQAQVAKNITTHFFVDYYTPPQDKYSDEKYTSGITIEELADTANSIGSTNENSSIDELTENMETDIGEPITNTRNEHFSERSTPIVDGSGLTVAVLSQFKSKQENLNEQHKKLIQACANNVKKATIITYAALFFASAALLSSIFLAIMLSEARSDIASLTESVATLKDDMESIGLKISAASMNKIPSNEQTDNSQESPKEKSMEHQSQISAEIPEKEQIKEELAIPAITDNSSAALQTPVSVVEKKPEIAPAPAILTIPANADKTTDITKSQDSIPTPAVTPLTIHANADKTTGRTNSQASDLENKHTVESTAVIKKTDTSTTPASTVTNSSARHEEPESKTIKKSPSTSATINHTKTPSATKDKTASNKTATNKPATVEKPATDKNKANSETWFVKIESVKEQQAAKTKASNLSKKGIPVKITKLTDNKHQIWYRLQTGSFKTREDANLYAEKLKKTHKLESISVTR